ncbi:solute carrier family 13 member 1 [Brachionus plicatilis]|uniref:Solute carrier family 13 member 1 n=1 Tax=Brachionus plicatilis TaxID=10195 RepID=A0A3M7S4E3_BRAPC|nr:solute carrier family 13 member 1 [Brachionus plicatilis]
MNGYKRNLTLRSFDQSSINQINHYKKGVTKFQQKCVGVIFVILVILWLTRDIQGLYGWGLLFQPKYVSDATPAVLAVFFLFACPKNNIFQGEDYVHLMNWKQLQTIFPWNVILLIGGGLAIAEGFQKNLNLE